ncbi:MAG: hypothetical protein V1847_02270 [Candidatus Diapherotrites archaeon]
MRAKYILNDVSGGLEKFRLRVFIRMGLKEFDFYRVDNSLTGRYHEDLLYKNPPLKHRILPFESENVWEIYRFCKQRIYDNWPSWLSAFQKNAQEKGFI